MPRSNFDPSPTGAPEPLSDDLRALEAGLRGLVPVSPGLNRDRLMFRAGRASVPRRWGWQAATAFSSLTALVLAMLLLTRPAAPVRERPVFVPGPTVESEGSTPPLQPDPEPTETAPDSGSQPPYRQIQEQILRWDLDGMPAASDPAEARPKENYRVLLRSF